MKSLIKVVLILLIVAQIISCNNAQSEAQKHADLIEQTMKKNSPGSVTTTESGSYIKAKIDGSEWSATTMIPDNNTSSNTKLVRGERGKDMIQFQLWKPALVAGKKKPFSDSSPAGIYMESNNALISGDVGEVEITKMDNEWVEGIFHFTATGVIYDAAGNTSPKTVVVTDGRFRVPNQ